MPAPDPNDPAACFRLGNALKDSGRLYDAIAAYQQAIAIRPQFPEALLNLGGVLTETGQADQAIDVFRQAIALNPNIPEAYSNLAGVLKEKARFEEALAACQRAIHLRPNYATPYRNIGHICRDQGRLDEAIGAYRRALALNPGSARAHSDLLFAMQFSHAIDAKTMAEELKRWNEAHAAPLRHLIRPHANDPNPNRRLRIGYVSPNLSARPIGWFLLPLLANHDARAVEVFAYAELRVPDETTQQLRSHTHAWRCTDGLSDDQVAQQIRDDQIDILVDLSLHSPRNRLLVFARKPAPIQVTYLAYAASSGLTTMDYRLSDPYLDPPDLHHRETSGAADTSIYTEQTLRLAQTYWCYNPIVDIPPQPPPVLKNGAITFGCLNEFAKVNPPLLALWARVLAAVPGSRLVLHAYPGIQRQRTLDCLRREGVDPRNVGFVARVSPAAYFQVYHSIDIALDTFPYGGGTTTCDALWMGVPVVTLPGQTAIGRGGVSILSNIGMPELIAATPEDYVRLAADLAGDLPRLTRLRSTLRERMRESPLMDAPGFARNFEGAYREIWRRWCAQ